LGKRASSPRKLKRPAKPPARKPRPRPKPEVAPAPTWDGLAAELAVNVRGIHRLRFEPGAPAKPDAEAWRAFIAARGANGADAKGKTAAELDREQADLRYARARAATAEREDAVSAGLVVTKAQATDAAIAVRDAFIREGELLAGAVLTLLPKFGRSDKDAVDNAVRQAWQSACMRIAAGMRA
jgi:hypothetical protein